MAWSRFTAPAGGPSASLSSLVVEIGTNAQASVTATANFVAGTYSVTASTTGAPTPASFHLTNTPALLTGVSVSWGTAGTDALSLAASSSGGPILPAGRKTDLPWLGIDQLTVTLSTAAP